jgi:galactokinase
MCQIAENKFVGVQSGLMDQFSSLFGQEDSFLFLDSRTFDNTALKSPTPFELVICDSMVKHELTGGEYNSRRAECESAATKLAARQLRDVSAADVTANKNNLSANEFKRALHVTSENARVLDAITAITIGDLEKIGILMNQSHESSKTLFENSTPELDQLAGLARMMPGCYGARLTGGGFGGAVICLVEDGIGEDFGVKLGRRYAAFIGKPPTVIVSKVAEGAAAVPVR